MKICATPRGGDFSVRRSGSRRGFTLVESLMVLVVIGLLLTLTIPLYGVLKSKAGLAGCLGNLRSISVALNGYLQDNATVWPQTPKAGFNGDTGQAAQWWLDTLKDYGVTQKTLICPSDLSTLKSYNSNPKIAVSSYGICQFDSDPGTAFKWNQPWAKENSGMHGTVRGPNMLMPDGTIQEGISLMSHH